MKIHKNQKSNQKDYSECLKDKYYIEIPKA